MGETLTNLAGEYPPQSRDALLALAEKIRIRNEREILEGLAALAADIGLDDMVNVGLEPDVNPQLMDALDTYPPIKEDLLATGELNQGQINNIKGKYFETLVEKRLNDGEALGELQLEPGQTARLATSASQKGWDLEIIDENGESVELLQLKATESMSYVKNALENHPDYHIVVPSEMDSASHELIGTDISHADLQTEAAADNVLEQLEEQTEGILENVADVSTEFALDSRAHWHPRYSGHHWRLPLLNWSSHPQRSHLRHRQFTPPGRHLEQHRLRTGRNWIGNGGAPRYLGVASSRYPHLCSSVPRRRPSPPCSGVERPPLPFPPTPHSSFQRICRLTSRYYLGDYSCRNCAIQDGGNCTYQPPGIPEVLQSPF